MTTATLLIIAAGLGTRMGGVSVPKAIAPINGKPNIENTLDKAHEHFGNIHIIANEKASAAWEDWATKINLDCADIHYISSGLGDGHAVLEGLKTMREEFPKFKPTEVTVMWGDAVVNNDSIFRELLSQDISGLPGIFPVVLESNPYVAALTDQHMNVTHIDFSKRGENHNMGFHDQSIFRFDTERLLEALEALHCAGWKGCRYIAEGNELNFLHVMHYLYNTGRPVKVFQTDYPLQSYNTQEELKAIEKGCS